MKCRTCRVPRTLPLVALGLAIVACGDSDAAEESAGSEPGIWQSGDPPGRTREWIDAHPLSEAQQELLNECLEERIGRRNLGEQGQPLPEELDAYGECAREQGVLDRVMVVEYGSGLDVDAANAELAAEAACLDSYGWTSRPEPADDRGLVFWEYSNLDFDDESQLREWNADRERCGVDVPDPTDVDGSEHTD